jgi:predicted MFS family arabinose efflux permease
VAEHREPSAGRLDVPGLILSGAGLSMLTYAISEGGAKGWGSLPILATAVGGVLALVAFVSTQRRRADPLLRLNLLGDRLFRATNIVTGFGSGAFIGSLYLTPIFLQLVHHLSPLDSGLTTFVEAVGVAFASQTLGRLYPRLGPRVMATVGGLSLAAALLCFLAIDGTTNLWLVRILMFLVGAFNSATFLGVQSAMFTTISSADTGHASAIYNTQRQTAIAASVAILTTIVASVHGSRLTAFHAAYIAAAMMAVLAALTAFTMIRTRDARSTMVTP